jgi:hypothetical protein
VAETIAVVWNAAWVMGREPVYIQSSAHGYAHVRSACFSALKKQFEVDTLRGLLLDDDILLKDQTAFMDAVLIADKYGWNFVSPYRVRDGYTTLADEKGTLMTAEEANALKPWDRVANGGLGFYYGDIPLGYVFHEFEPYGGEDLNFFHDNRWLDIRQIDLKLQHLKSMPLSLDTNMGKLPSKIEGRRRQEQQEKLAERQKEQGDGVDRALAKLETDGAKPPTSEVAA